MFPLLWFVGTQTRYISHCELEFAAFGGYQTLTGNGARARMCAFLTLRNTESPRKLGKLTKDCSLELCRGSDQNPEVCLQIPCSSCWRLLQTPDLLCSVREGLPASVSARSSPVKQGPHPPPHSSLQFRAGREKGIRGSHHQCGDGCHCWTLKLLKASLGTFHTNL